MAGYGWDEYDVRQGGRQTIHDAGNKLDLTTEFVKFPGGEHGGSWGTRIKGTPREDAPEHLMTTVIFYASMEGLGRLGVSNEPSNIGYEATVTLSGQTGKLGEFKIDITAGPDTNRHPPRTHQAYGNKPLDRTHIASFVAPEEAIWQTKRTYTYHANRDTNINRLKPYCSRT
jgi:mannosyl-oligosaccharide glucosidase